MSYRCRACKAPVTPFMSLGRMPLANGFLGPADIVDEIFYDLRPAVCETCQLFQIVETPPPRRIFHSAYPHVTGTSTVVAEHFRALADDIARRFLTNPDPFVVELGSNDGTLLANFARKGIRHLGIEPASEIAAVARTNGVETLEAFFDAATAARVRAARGPADVIVGANVVAHIADINGVAEGMAILLADRGLCVIENIYLGDLVANTAYDQIYDEHVFTYSVFGVSTVFGRFGLDVLDVQHLPTQGGSLRYLLGRRGLRAPAPAVAAYLARERSSALHAPETMAAFRARAERQRDALVALIRDLRRQGKTVAGYGAATKSTIVLNYCGLTADDIAYVVDSTPAKQNKLTPGTHIPVLPPSAFHERPVDYALLFAWNHAREIMNKERGFSGRGGRWIIPVPEPHVV